MKTISILSAALIILGLNSCNEIDPAPFADFDQSARISKIDRILIEHAWRVDFFWNAGTDETSGLAAYSLEFHENGKVKAGNGIEAYYGQWQSYQVQSVTMLGIKFLAEGPVSSMSNTWHVVQIPSGPENLLKLEHMVRDKMDSSLLHLEMM
jgi:hypothetical protein